MIPDDPPPIQAGNRRAGDTLALFRFLAPQRRRLTVATAALLLGCALRLVFPYVTGNLVDGTLMTRGFDLNRADAWYQDIDVVALVMLAVLTLTAVAYYFEFVFFASAGERAVSDLRVASYSNMVMLPMAFFSRRRVGELSSRMLSDLTQIQEMWIYDLPMIMKYGAVLAGGLILLAVTSLELAAVVFMVLPPVVLFAALIGRRIRKVSKAAQDKLADSAVVIEETLHGIQDVKAYANEGHEIDRFHGSIRNYLKHALRGARWRGAMNSGITFALLALLVFVMWHGSRLVLWGRLTPGEFTRFMFLMAFVGTATGTVAEMFGKLQKSIGANTRIREILGEVPETRLLDRRAATAGETVKVRGEIAFERVSFAYPGRPDAPVLRDVGFRLEAGRKLALVGPSGGGKSTIVSLVLRLYDPVSGVVLVDGRDARDYPLRALRGNMAVVPQEVMLFGGSIAENIGYGKPGASREDIVVAAEKANAREFIEAFPDRYETLVGDRGIRLSGGQRQRIAIARAFLKNPPILILDEATSSLDSQSESLVQDALHNLMGRRTTIVIAHRLSTVREADCIFVVNEGRVVETGTHDDLIALGGLYSALCLQQFGKIYPGGRPESSPANRGPGGRKTEAPA